MEAVRHPQAARDRDPRQRPVAEEVLLPASLSSRVDHLQGAAAGRPGRAFYPDLADERFVSALALVHQRYSTNTFPTWDLAHPFRYLAHNGEINTLRGNVNWMHARESMFASEKYGDDLKKICPVCTPGASDSADVRQRAGTAGAHRPLAAAGDVDADSRAVGRTTRACRTS